MDPENIVNLSSAPPPKIALRQHELETDVWEPPFERWIKLADDLLSGWVCEAASGQPQRLKPPFRAS